MGGYQKAVIVLITASVAGCAWTPEKYAAKRTTLDDTETCRLLLGWQKEAKEPYLTMVREEVARRGLTEEACAQKYEGLRQARRKAIGAAIVLTATAAAIAYASRSRPAYPVTSSADTSWDWDQFANSDGVLVWACRGVQTTQFAEQWHCIGKPQTDLRWPAK